MRYGRFTVLSLSFILTGLLAASLAPWSISAVVNSCLEPAELGLAAADTATAGLAGDAAVAVEADTGSGWRFWAPGASRFMAMPRAASRTSCNPPGAHSGRAPPLA
jgi:hypothetical protein